MAYLCGYKNVYINIYPFGGITKYDGYLNESLLKEFFILLGGPLFQEILYLILLYLYNDNLISNYNYDIIYFFHINLLYFNFLPITPLDGSRLLTIILELFIPYKLSNILIIYISFITIFILSIFDKRILIIIFSCLLIKSIYEEALNINIKYNKFLLERYLYNFKFKKTILIKNINNFMRNKNHKIIHNDKIYSEKEYLKNVYKSL